jgi:hypothetical protein
MLAKAVYRLSPYSVFTVLMDLLVEITKVIYNASATVVETISRCQRDKNNRVCSLGEGGTPPPLFHY